MSWWNLQMRPFLNTIANELISDQVEELKFLCYPKLTRTRLEKVNTAQQLFVAISEVFNEENEQLDYLKELFSHISRKDLEKKIEHFQQVRAQARGLSQQKSSTLQSRYPSSDSHQLSASGQQVSYSQGHSPTDSLTNPYNDKVQSYSDVTQYSSQQSVPYGQEEMWPQQATQPGDQPDKGHASSGSDRSVSEGRGASENIHLSPQSSTECRDSDKSVVDEGLRCPVEMTYQSMQQYFHISDESKLGEGGFGTVYEGCRKFHGQNVVVKMEHEQPQSQGYRAAQLKREKLVGFIKHPNLMPLFAVCEEKGRPCCLMYPLMDSDLQKALHRDLRGKKSLPWECRVRIALHTARGLQYLHTRVKNERNVREEIVHMDVKPGNIFLDKHLNARLGDPGMAQELEAGYSFASISQTRGTEGYLDRYLRDTHFKPINDVFSFGIVLLQLLTQRDAVESRADRNVKLWKHLDEGGYLSSPTKLMEQARSVWPRSGPTGTIIFCGIAIDCLKKPDERAKLPDVCQKLEDILEKQGEEFYASKPADGGRCISCLLNLPAKYLEVRSNQCDNHTTESCNHFCVTCLTQSQRNPLQCPQHGPAEPPIGRTNTYALLVCGDDPNNKKASAAFMRDVSNFRNTLTDNRIVGVRNDHLYCITPSKCVSTVGSEVKRKLQYLEEELQGKRDVFLYFYFSGHSDERGNLICSSESDLLTETDLRKHLEQLEKCVDELIIILDCCFADSTVPNKHLGSGSSPCSKSESAINKSEKFPAQPLEYLLGNRDEIEVRAGKEHLHSAVDETDLDSLDGAVMTKDPKQVKQIETKSRSTFSVRQWSSSLGQQESLAVPKGSFFSLFMINGLRGGHSSSLCIPNCKICEKFQDKAKAVGYISAANLEDYISQHVVEAARAKDKDQTPCVRALRTKETKLAYFNQEILCDEIQFKHASGSSERIVMTEFSPSLVEFESDLLGKLHGKLPACTKGKHLHVVCEEEEIDSTSFHDVKNLARQGYDVKCQLRPCSFIHKGPVMVEIQRCKKSVESFLESLGLAKVECSASSPYMMFQAETSRRQYTRYDIDECLGENTELRGLLDGSVIESITIILKTASLYRGLLSITVYEDHLDCECQTSEDF